MAKAPPSASRSEISGSRSSTSGTDISGFRPPFLQRLNEAADLSGTATSAFHRRVCLVCYRLHRNRNAAACRAIRTNLLAYAWLRQKVFVSVGLIVLAAAMVVGFDTWSDGDQGFFSFWANLVVGVKNSQVSRMPFLAILLNQAQFHGLPSDWFFGVFVVLNAVHIYWLYSGALSPVDVWFAGFAFPSVVFMSCDMGPLTPGMLLLCMVHLSASLYAMSTPAMVTGIDCSLDLLLCFDSEPHPEGLVFLVLGQLVSIVVVWGVMLHEALTRALQEFKEAESCSLLEAVCTISCDATAWISAKDLRIVATSRAFDSFLGTARPSTMTDVSLLYSLQEVTPDKPVEYPFQKLQQVHVCDGTPARVKAADDSDLVIQLQHGDKSFTLREVIVSKARPYMLDRIGPVLLAAFVFKDPVVAPEPFAGAPVLTAPLMPGNHKKKKKKWKCHVCTTVNSPTVEICGTCGITRQYRAAPSSQSSGRSGSRKAIQKTGYSISSIPEDEQLSVELSLLERRNGDSDLDVKKRENQSWLRRVARIYCKDGTSGTDSVSS